MSHLPIENSDQSPKFSGLFPEYWYTQDSISIILPRYIFHKTHDFPFTHQDRVLTYQALEKNLAMI